MAKISDINAHQILDSRGIPTVEVTVTTDDGIMATDSVPSGTSTGSFEAKAIEPQIAVANINEKIKPKIIGLDPTKQREIDEAMLALDGTEDKSALGANSILGVSLAVARAGAQSQKMPLYWHINKLYGEILGEDIEPKVPIPMMVMIEGGKHAENNVCIQEFSIITKLENGRKIWHALKKEIESLGQVAKLGLEGGFSPKLKYDEDALGLIVKAVNASSFKIPQDVKIALDVAANNCQIRQDDIMALMDHYPIFSIEDPVSEDNWTEWSALKSDLDSRKKDYLLIGDDLFVTNKKRLEKGISLKSANGIIIKVNQVGTLLETLEVIALAKKSGIEHVLSHRSGETMDTFIADLSVGTAAQFMKSGAPYASEREIKYKRLEEIAREL